MYERLITLMPWSQSKNLGLACNESMSLLSENDIGVIIDYDIMWTTPHWYDQLLGIFNQHSDAGIVTVVTNRIGNFDQLPIGIDEQHPVTRSHDIFEHRKFGNELMKKYGTNVIDYTHKTYQISGLVIAVPKKVWEKVPFPEDTMFGMDNEYHRRVRDRGFRILIASGVYCYHWYRGEQLDLTEARKKSYR
jgi:GT2 family glycosyltransferase